MLRHNYFILMSYIQTIYFFLNIFMTIYENIRILGKMMKNYFGNVPTKLPSIRGPVIDQKYACLMNFQIRYAFEHVMLP